MTVIAEDAGQDVRGGFRSASFVAGRHGRGHTTIVGTCSGRKTTLKCLQATLPCRRRLAPRPSSRSIPNSHASTGRRTASSVKCKPITIVMLYQAWSRVLDYTLTSRHAPRILACPDVALLSPGCRSPASDRHFSSPWVQKSTRRLDRHPSYLHCQTPYHTSLQSFPPSYQQSLASILQAVSIRCWHAPGIWQRHT